MAFKVKEYEIAFLGALLSGVQRDWSRLKAWFSQIMGALRRE